MKPLLPEAFRQYLGLSSIALIDEAQNGAQLPEDHRLQPIDAGIEARLQALLQADTFDTMILEAVRPKAFDRNVLAPSRFHQLCAGVTAQFARRLPLAAGPAAAEELHAAIAVLRLRSSEQELGEALRYALLKG